EGEGIAQAEGVDELVDAGGSPHERVVGRDQVPDTSVVARRGALVEGADVDAELLAQEVGEGLRDTVGGHALGERLKVVSGIDVEHAVEAEVDRAGVVAGAAQSVQVEDGSFAGEHRLSGNGGVDGEPTDLVVHAGGP